MTGRDRWDDVEILDTLRLLGPSRRTALLALSARFETEGSLELAHALGRIGGPEALAALIAALRHRDAGVRTRAALALGVPGLDTGAVVPALAEALSDPAPEVRREAARSLGQHGPAAAWAVESLLAARDAGDRELRSRVAEALARIEPEARPPALRAPGTPRLVDGDAESAAAWLRAGLDPAPARRLLARELRSDQRNVLDLIANLGPLAAGPEIETKLEQVLRTPDFEKHVAVLVTLRAVRAGGLR